MAPPEVWLRLVDHSLLLFGYLQRFFLLFLHPLPRPFSIRKNFVGNGSDALLKPCVSGISAERPEEDDEIDFDFDADEDDDEEEEEKGDFHSYRGVARRGFASLGQVDADFVLARRLQEQEAAYMLLTDNNVGGDESGSEYELRSYDDEDSDFSEERGSVVDSAPFFEDYADYTISQEDLERELTTRLMALAGIGISEEIMEYRHRSQEAWLEIDPDELTYEELLALGEVVGTVGKGLSADTISSLPSLTYQSTGSEEMNDQCVICRLDFDDGENLVHLPCKHIYHPECINRWLQINKICPICSADVVVSGNSRT
ncbi:E3 ubiquitin ligase BIG BROTHER-related-like [Wolffia australiana]